MKYKNKAISGLYTKSELEEWHEPAAPVLVEADAARFAAGMGDPCGVLSQSSFSREIEEKRREVEHRYQMGLRYLEGMEEALATMKKYHVGEDGPDCS